MAQNLTTAIQGARTLLATLETIEQVPDLQAQITKGFQFTMAEISQSVEECNDKLRYIASFLTP